MMKKVLSSSRTHVGNVRKSNQDSIFSHQQNGLFIVADGMGGHQGGDIASQMSCKLIPEFFQQIKDDYPDKNPIEILRESILLCNSKIYEKSLENKLHNGMGTTLMMIYIDDQNIYLANVGDSRCYLVHQNNIFQLSVDHTLVQEKVNMGLYTRERAARDPMKNILVRALGHQESLEIDLFSYKYHPHDIFLLCSDGLYGDFSDKDMLKYINHYIPDSLKYTTNLADQLLEKMFERVLSGPGKDNISAIMLNVVN